MKPNLFFDQVEEFTPLKKDTRGFGFNDTLSDLSPKLGSKEEYVPLNKQLKIFHVYTLVFILVFVVFVFLLKSFDLQVFKKGIYANKSENNRTRKITVQPNRGVIYGFNDVVIARNKPAFDVDLNTLECRINPKDLDYCKKIIEEVGKLLNLNLSESLSILGSETNVITLASGLVKEDIISLETNLYKFPGLSVAVSPLREYPYPEIFSHVLGYTGLDEKSLQPIYIGKSGVESKYNQYLSGVQGFEIIQIDSTGKSFELVAKADALPGRNIHTFLNVDLQNKAFELLKNVVDAKKATGGAIVAQDPKTGGVRALVSYPSYDANKLSAGLSNSEYKELINKENFPFFNRATAAVYPPGSTFKMVVASAALEEKIVQPNTTIFDPGFIQIGTYIFRNWKLSGHGEVNLVKALQVSNDTYFYTIGGGHGSIKGLGIAKLNSWSKKFGFGSLTQIDIDGEVTGYMPDGVSREWYLGDTYITSIGQGDVLATPLQVNNMVSYFANGGYLFKPRVVEAIDGGDEIETIILNQNIISGKNYELVREGMRAVVEPGGTAYPLFDFSDRHNGIKLAGKTGTSEFIDSKGEEKTHAWISVFGPYEDANIVLTVFLEGGGAGSDDAGPIAKELLDLWFRDIK